mmetsp:Transcript_31756/g.62882  ORF Transcript_31756/g.62882 Transcript_31756/m.62882 type:complete len:243 (-) Transcript_31756:76-804(-)
MKRSRNPPPPSDPPKIPRGSRNWVRVPVVRDGRGRPSSLSRPPMVSLRRGTPPDPTAPSINSDALSINEPPVEDEDAPEMPEELSERPPPDEAGRPRRDCRREFPPMQSPPSHAHSRTKHATWHSPSPKRSALQSSAHFGLQSPPSQEHASLSQSESHLPSPISSSLHEEGHSSVRLPPTRDSRKETDVSSERTRRVRSEGEELIAPASSVDAVSVSSISSLTSTAAVTLPVASVTLPPVSP